MTMNRTKMEFGFHLVACGWTGDAVRRAMSGWEYVLDHHRASDDPDELEGEIEDRAAALAGGYASRHGEDYAEGMWAAARLLRTGTWERPVMTRVTTLEREELMREIREALRLSGHAPETGP